MSSSNFIIDAGARKDEGNEEDDYVDGGGDLVVINGYHPMLRIDDITLTIAEKVLRLSKGKHDTRHAHEGVPQGSGRSGNGFRGFQGFKDFAGKGKHSNSASDHCQFLRTFFSGRAPDLPTPGCPSRLFLVIHNIDGPGLRSPQAQSALSILAGILLLFAHDLQIYRQVNW